MHGLVAKGIPVKSIFADMMGKKQPEGGGRR